MGLDGLVFPERGRSTAASVRLVREIQSCRLQEVEHGRCQRPTFLSCESCVFLSELKPETCPTVAAIFRQTTPAPFTISRRP
ncbi:hypothetical protein BRADI_4g20554v3 [Brachypodium distachyon]|uniref:Uncharacterized protein n=1 Tax=Brachypodium distachyon TaxID=15368 RepID=A0A2K2CNY7_BRADI|nr:hypothetical protein BRADI_4g20554v3 [Brachypodium distachyon]